MAPDIKSSHTSCSNYRFYVTPQGVYLEDGVDFNQPNLPKTMTRDGVVYTNHGVSSDVVITNHGVSSNRVMTRDEARLFLTKNLHLAKF